MPAPPRPPGRSGPTAAAPTTGSGATRHDDPDGDEIDHSPEREIELQAARDRHPAARRSDLIRLPEPQR